MDDPRPVMGDLDPVMDDPRPVMEAHQPVMERRRRHMETRQAVMGAALTASSSVGGSWTPSRLQSHLPSARVAALSTS